MAADDLSRAQAKLGRALGRARAGEDRDLSHKVSEAGEGLAHLIAGLLRMNRLHKADNRAFDLPVAEVCQVLGQLVELLGPVHLVTVDDQVYVNEVRIRTEGSGGGKDLGVELARHNVGGITFHGALEPGQVRALVAALAAKPAQEARRRTLQKALDEIGIRTIELTPRHRFRLQGDDEVAARHPSEAIRHTLRLAEETYENLAMGRVLNPLPLRRAVVEILDIGPERAELWEAVAEGPPHATHASSVTLVALLVGRAVGLRAAVLHDLGLAALIHDVGYAGLPPSVAPGAEGLERHPVEGARLMLRQRGFHEAKLRRLRAVMDHHADHSRPRGEPSLLGQILRLAEDYMTLLRVMGARISPVDALGSMVRASEEIYHPALVQLLVNVLGAYPPGTLLELADGRYARSISPVRSEETFAAPLIRLIDIRTRALSNERYDLAQGGVVNRVLAG